VKKIVFDTGRLKLLNPAQVVRYGPVIQAAAHAAFGEFSTPAGLVNYMGDVYTGKIQVWAILGKKDETTHFLGLITTRILEDPRFGTRRLYVETIAAYGSITREVWAQGLAQLERYAADENCVAVEGDTHSESMLRMLTRFGFEPVTTKVRKEIAHGRSS